MDTTKQAAVLRDMISKQLESAVREAQLEAKQHFIEYLNCRAGDRNISPDKILPADVVAFDRGLQLIKQEWAKKHGIVPQPAPAKANG